MADHVPHIEISDYGDDHALLANQAFMNRQSRTFPRQDITLDQDLWGGRLGRYHKALRITTEAQAVSGKESGKERRAQSSGCQR